MILQRSTGKGHVKHGRKKKRKYNIYTHTPEILTAGIQSDFGNIENWVNRLRTQIR